MANARDVLDVALEEADLLSHSGGDLQQIAPIIRLAHRAFLIGDGDMDDDEVRASGIPSTKLARLGL